MSQKHKALPARDGMALGIIVVVLGVFAVAAATLLVQSGISELMRIDALQSASKARGVLQSCHDEVNAQLRRSSGYAPTSVSASAGTCSSTITTNGTTRLVTLSYTLNSVTKTLSYTFDTTTYVESGMNED